MLPLQCSEGKAALRRGAARRRKRSPLRQRHLVANGRTAPGRLPPAACPFRHREIMLSFSFLKFLLIPVNILFCCTVSLLHADHLLRERPSPRPP